MEMITGMLSQILQAWQWMHPWHIANTELAQAQLDQTYLEEQTTEYQTKERIAEKRAKRLIATEKPILFLKRYVWSTPVGSVDERKNLKYLNTFSPEFCRQYLVKAGASREALMTRLVAAHGMWRWRGLESAVIKGIDP
jgi:hypothetical protein